LSHALSHLLNGNPFTSIKRANPGIDRFKQFRRFILLKSGINFDDPAKDCADAPSVRRCRLLLVTRHSA
jgi:hypothetical protein